MHRCSFFLMLAVSLWGSVSSSYLYAQQNAPKQHLLDARNAEGLRYLLGYTGETLPLVSAHRGGPAAGFPENCLATFEKTLRTTYALLEVDPRRTKDGHFVLHHDAQLERTTNGVGLLIDHTLAELKQLRLKDNLGALTEYKMPTLDEALEWARGKAILVLDQKDLTIDERIRAIEEHDAEHYCMLIVYSLREAAYVFRKNPDLMMEVMIPNREKYTEFLGSGIPWNRIIAFVGHSPPEDPGLLQLLHADGVCCLAGTSRHLDREFLSGRQDLAELLPEYRKLLNLGVDLIETDIPRELATGLFSNTQLPTAKTHFFYPPE